MVGLKLALLYCANLVHDLHHFFQQIIGGNYVPKQQIRYVLFYRDEWNARTDQLEPQMQTDTHVLYCD